MVRTLSVTAHKRTSTWCNLQWPKALKWRIMLSVAWNLRPSMITVVTVNLLIELRSLPRCTSPIVAQEALWLVVQLEVMETLVGTRWGESEVPVPFQSTSHRTVLVGQEVLEIRSQLWQLSPIRLRCNSHDLPFTQKRTKKMSSGLRSRTLTSFST